MKTRKVAVTTGLAGLCVSVIAFAGGPLVAEAALQTLTCTSVAVAGGGHANVCHMVTAVSLTAPIIHQSMPLDCESAALAVALESKGFPMTQTWVFDELPKQPQEALISRERPVTWGDPYEAFVGNVYGSEANYTGYGVYYPPIAAVAELAGATTDARTGWTTESDRGAAPPRPSGGRLDEFQLRLLADQHMAGLGRAHRSVYHRGARGHGGRIQLSGRDRDGHRRWCWPSTHDIDG